jgi:hypothetical protein
MKAVKNVSAPGTQPNRFCSWLHASEWLLGDLHAKRCGPINLGLWWPHELHWHEHEHEHNCAVHIGTVVSDDVL